MNVPETQLMSVSILQTSVGSQIWQKFKDSLANGLKELRSNESNALLGDVDNVNNPILKKRIQKLAAAKENQQQATASNIVEGDEPEEQQLDNLGSKKSKTK